MKVSIFNEIIILKLLSHSHKTIVYQRNRVKEEIKE